MLNISDETMNEFSNGTSAKRIELELEGYDYPAEEVNRFISDGSDNDWKCAIRTADRVRLPYVQFYNTYITENTLKNSFWHPYFVTEENVNRYRISMDVYFEEFPSNAAERPMAMYCDYGNVFGESYSTKTKAQLQAATKDNPVRVYFDFNNKSNDDDGIIYMTFKVYETTTSTSAGLPFKVWYRNISITKTGGDYPYHKSLVKNGKLPLPKVIIDNEHIEKEQLSLTESLCSSDNLIFGSAEASCLNIGVVDTKQDFKDRIIKPRFYFGEDDPTKYNYDSINWSSEDTNIEYLQKYGNSDRNYAVGRTVNMSVYNIWGSSNKWREYVQYALGVEFGMRVYFKTVGFSGTKAPKKLVVQILYKHTENGANMTAKYQIPLGADGAWVDETFSIFKPFSASDSVYKFVGAQYYFADENGTAVAQGSGTYQEFSIFVFNIGIYLHTENKKDTPFKKETQYIALGVDPLTILREERNVPLGRFKVDSVQKTVTHTLTKKNITAYDECYNLEQNAADWYTFYMYGINSQQYDSRYGFEFARQIYSSYFNLAKQLGLESIDHENEKEVLYYAESNGTAASKFASNFSMRFNDENGDGNNFLHYTTALIDAKPTSLYRVRLEADDFISDRSIMQFKLGNDFSLHNDPYARGFTTKASICVVEYDSSNNAINKFLVDADDYFKLSDDCKKIRIYVPYGWNKSENSSSGLSKYMDRVWVYELPKQFELINASTRLLYYRYFGADNQTGIFACDSNVTARDVIRSLLEPTGCFYHIDRYGKPCFRYCTKAGLYPSNNLYPADYLYPRRAIDGQTLSMGRYITFVADDYVVEDIGKIQILKNIYTNESKTVCEWEYVGNPTVKNTYIIDSNIFYCHEDMMYELDAMPEVSSMLTNLYAVISNIGYTPNTTVAVGMPWVEVGDRIGLLTDDGGIESFIFRRTMNGIQKIRDTYESAGDEYTEAIKDYAYSQY